MILDIEYMAYRQLIISQHAIVATRLCHALVLELLIKHLSSKDSMQTADILSTAKMTRKKANRMR